LNCERILRANSQGLGSLGLSYKVQGAAGGAAAGAEVGSAILPGIGTAVGAVVGAIAGALFSKKKDPNAAEKEALKGQLDDYMRVQGSVPGRAFNLLTLKQLIDGAGYRGMWPNIKKWSGDAINGAIEGCKGCTPPTIRQFVKDQVAAGDIDPMSLASKFTEHVNRTWGSKWFIQSAGATQRQLMIDLMDYFISQEKPDAPLFYAPSWTVAANAPAPAPAPTPQPVTQAPAPTIQIPVTQQQSQRVPEGVLSVAGTSPAGVTVFRDSNGALWLFQNTGYVPYEGVLRSSGTLPVQPPTSAQLPNASVTPTATQPQVDVGALVSTLMQQGATQQQAFLSAMQNLQSQGVPATPQVQQQVAEQVQSAGSGAGLPTWALIAIPLALGTAVLVGGRSGKRRG
jgi:hypothetical protein